MQLQERKLFIIVLLVNYILGGFISSKQSRVAFQKRKT